MNNGKSIQILSFIIKRIILWLIVCGGVSVLGVIFNFDFGLIKATMIWLILEALGAVGKAMKRGG